MSTQRPHHVSSLAFRISGLFLIPTRSVGAYYSKRTLNKTHATGVPPLYLTPTEVGDPPTTKKCKTNPIPPGKNAKRTQFTPQPPSPRPKYAKRTQFAPRPQHPPTKKCETNPIPAADLWRTKKTKRTQSHPANSQSPKAKSQKTRNEPNLCPANMQNEPNLSPGGPVEDKKCETNPIPTLVIPAKAGIQKSCPTPKMRNEPNFQQPIYTLQSTIYNPMPQPEQASRKPLRHKHLGGRGVRSLFWWNQMTNIELRNVECRSGIRPQPTFVCSSRGGGICASGPPGDFSWPYDTPTPLRIWRMRPISFCPGGDCSERLCPVSGSTGSWSDRFFSCLGVAIRCSVLF